MSFALACLASSAVALRPALLATRPPRACTIVAQADDEPSDTAGVGFGDAGAEERGRRELERMRAASGERGYDYTLQGLQDPNDEQPPAEVPQEFKSTVTLGLAGFLILGGIVSIVVGGALWSDSNEGAPPPAEDTPAFGFVPSAAPAPGGDAMNDAPQ